MRIPEKVKRAWVNGKEVQTGEFYQIRQIWDNQEITLTMEMEAELVQRPNGLWVAERGNLMFSLPISYESEMHEYEKDGVERKFPYCDYEFTPTTDWNYGFASSEFVCERQKFKNAFSTTNPPMILKAKMAKVDWKTNDQYPDVCAEFPESNKAINEMEEKTLYPYGCTNLRMTEMPIVD